MAGCKLRRQGTIEPCRHLSRKEVAIRVADQVNDLCEGVVAECILQRDKLLNVVPQV